MLGTVELTTEELILADSLHWTYPSTHHEAAYWFAHGERAATLFSTLLGRGALPNIRLSVFADPKYNPGHSSDSHYDVFLRNAGSRHEVLRHYHFIKYLRYFIYGADLPNQTIEAFVSAYEDGGGDLEPLLLIARSHARELKQRMGYHAAEKHEEFYKLALDAGCQEYRARQVRGAVMPILRSR